MREYLEKNYAETSGGETIKLAVKALLEVILWSLSFFCSLTKSFCCIDLQVVESAGKNIEIAVMTKKEGLRFLSDEEVDQIVAVIEEEKAAAEAAKKGGQQQTQQ